MNETEQLNNSLASCEKQLSEYEEEIAGFKEQKGLLEDILDDIKAFTNKY